MSHAFIVEECCTNAAFEAFFGHKPSVSHLCIFGCVAFAHLPSGQRRKFDSKTDLCIFLGYSLSSKGYRLWHVEHQKVIERRHVLFDEASTMGRLKVPSKRVIANESDDSREFFLCS